MIWRFWGEAFVPKPNVMAINMWGFKLADFIEKFYHLKDLIFLYFLQHDDEEPVPAEESKLTESSASQVTSKQYCRERHESKSKT